MRKNDKYFRENSVLFLIKYLIFMLDIQLTNLGGGAQLFHFMETVAKLIEQEFGTSFRHIKLLIRF